MSAAIVTWFIAINVITFAAYGIDRSRARRRRRRIPDEALLVMSFCGGSLAAYIAQRTLNHKTGNTTFQHQFQMMVMLQVLIFGILLLAMGLGEFSWYGVFHDSRSSLL